MSCPVKDQCTKAKYGKGVQRSENQHYINNNKERAEQNKDYYRRRQAIVEHPFGTMKRAWGLDHIMTRKGIERASADVGLIFIAYNLRRLINLIGIKNLGSCLSELLSIFLALITALILKNNQFKPPCFSNIIQPLFLCIHHKGLYSLKINCSNPNSVVYWRVLRRTAVSCKAEIKTALLKMTFVKK